jgi:hypothetical protein
VGESNCPVSGPFLLGSPCNRQIGGPLGPRGQHNLDRTSVGKPCGWPRGASQTVISSTVVQPNAEASKICSSYAWETFRAQLPYIPPPFAIFAKIKLEGKGKRRGEGWANSLTELCTLHFYFNFEKLGFLCISVFA